MPQISATPRIPVVDPFASATWQPGQVEKTIDVALAKPVDTKKCGQFESGYKEKFLEKYLDSMGGKPIESFDPNGFLTGTLGMAPPRSAGRTSADMLKAFKLIDDYKPDPKYLPLPKWIAPMVQWLMLGLNKISSKACAWVDKLFTKLVVQKMEKPDTEDPNPFGKMEDIIKGDRQAISSNERYFGIRRSRRSQHAWGQGVHRGSVSPDQNGGGKFGTYDLAKSLGFTMEQAKRIADSCDAVDTDETHYRDPQDPSKRRVTVSGSGGEKGDFHWHFNRSPEGMEDTRISAAKVHLERATTLAKQGYFNAAERELGIGLHSLQDVFAHSQITPLNHSLLGEFPDFVKYNPIGMYEAAQATEAYLQKFAESLKLAAPPVARVQSRAQKIAAVVGGDAAPEKKMAVGSVIGRYPEGLTELLEKNQIQIHVAAPGSRPTDLGFGADLDGDGVISVGKWVDVNRDGKQQAFEIEDRRADGTSWNDAVAAYDHNSKTIFVSNEALRDPARLDQVLRHEIRHAVDRIFSEDPKLQVRWNSYIGRLFEAARRNGDVAFDGLDPHEVFARAA